MKHLIEKNRTIPFHIKLADMVVRMEPIYDYIQKYCEEYITNEKETVTVRIESEDIVFEREHSVKEYTKFAKESLKSENFVTEIPIVQFSDAYLETLAVYRKIAEQFPFFNRLLFHGSAIAVDGEGYLFTAKSGTGKSTHTRFWREYFGNRAVMINDDKPLLEVTDKGIIAYGTPWNGKHRLSTNIAVPLKAICILTRDKENYIEKIKPSEAYQMLLQQTYRPMDRIALVQTLKLIDELMKKVTFYKLGCNMELKAAEVAYFGMQE